MAQLSSLSSVRRPAKSARSRVRPLDPMATVQSLASECRAASDSVAKDGRRWREADALRQSARELALLLDACGGGVFGASTAIPPSPAAGVAFVMDRYRAVLDVQLPRALREALRTQLARLEGFGMAEGARAA